MPVEVESVRVEGSRLAELYLRHGTDAQRLAYLLTGDRAVAEDIVQDAFVKLAGRLTHLRSADAFEPYLRRTVVNLANAHFRRRKVERRYLERQAGLALRAQTPPDPTEHEVVWAAILTLPPRSRAAIVLRYYEDLSETQIAEVMRCRPGTVKSLVSRGLDRLRPLMEGD